MLSIYAQKWGRPLEQAGYTQLSNLLLRRWREIGLSRTERDIIIGIISYQDDPETKTIPSLKQVAYEAGQCYQTARKNLKHLTDYKKDGGLGLLIPVLLTHGRTRYNMMPLRRELETLEIVKPAPRPRPVPKPAPIVTIHEEDRDAWVQKEWEEIDENAYADWEEIKEFIRPQVSKQIFHEFLEETTGFYRDSDEVLHVKVPTSGHREALEGRFARLIDECRRFYGIAAIAAATMGV